MIPVWFINMLVCWWCCHIWAEVGFWAAGYPYALDGGEAGNAKFAQFYGHYS